MSLNPIDKARKEAKINENSAFALIIYQRELELSQLKAEMKTINDHLKQTQFHSADNLRALRIRKRKLKGEIDDAEIKVHTLKQ